MADLDDVLGGLDQPRPLGPELRERLEDALGADGVAVLLAEAERPRPLPPALRARLVGELVPPRVPVSWGRGVAAAAAVAGLVAGVALLLPADQEPRHSTAVGRPSTAVPDRVLPGAGTANGDGKASAPSPQPSGERHARTASKPSYAGQARDGEGAAPQPASGVPPARPGAPAVTSLDPASGPITGGTVVTVTGGGFTPGAVVHFGEAQATEVEVVSSSELRVTTPPHLPGEVDVAVTTAGGTSTPGPGTRYRYLA